MNTIIANDTTATLALFDQFTYPIIEQKATWADTWTRSTDLEILRFDIKSGGNDGISTAEVKRRYGTIKQPNETTYHTLTTLDLAASGGTWIRISLLGNDTNSTPILAFMGTVDGQANQLRGENVLISGTTGSQISSGVQNWTVSGGLRILQKLVVSESIFVNGSANDVSRVGWLPDMNSRDAHGMIVGNRSTDAYDPRSSGTYSFIYGAVGNATANIWSHLQYVTYLVQNFIQNDTGPKWTLGGASTLLNAMETTIEFEACESALSMLRKLIPPKYGVDFAVIPTKDNGTVSSDGYQIYVYALLGEDLTINGVTYPKNPNTLTVKRDDQLFFTEAHLVESTARRVDKIRVMGKRIVVCGTLAATANDPTLVPKWSATLEADYIADTGADIDETDRRKNKDKYRDVYRKFGAPVDWDLDGSTIPTAHIPGSWAKECGTDGTLSSGGQFQNLVRHTLNFTPLREGFDYSTNPPTDTTLADSEPEFKPPIAWVVDPEPDGGGDPVYVQCDLVGMHIHSSPHDWGLFVEASPNHLLALNNFTNSADVTISPKYDYNTLVATIAIPVDHRIQLGYDVPTALAAGDGSIMTVVDEGAELWVILESTAYDVDDDGTLLFTPSEMIVRDDTDRLALALTGLVARYINERVKARLVFKGFQPLGGLIGNILSVVQQGDEITNIGGPVTSVEWIQGSNGNSPQTIFSAGYA